MFTSRIKRFATEARSILKAGVAAKMLALGFDKSGGVKPELRPRPVQGGSVWKGRLQTEGFFRRWMSLYERVQQKGISEVHEEAAYTWFGRLCAIRILRENGLCQPVLEYAGAARTPVIVDEARQGHLPPMGEEERLQLLELLDDDTKTTEQFASLLTTWCHANPIINACFGSVADYTELLLPANILAPGGFLDRLNLSEFISPDDFRSPELIGWLYQFYISERKDEVYAKNGKFEVDDIPAATQIFTPNWIVKYMVQNTLGRIYLDSNPYDDGLGDRWQYLVEPAQQTAADAVMHYDELTDLRIADLACGSGHILNECFDLLFDLYISEGYGRREAIKNIFSRNLTGVDIDTRARQLAMFALLLKACQRDAGFADAGVLPRIFDVPRRWSKEFAERLPGSLRLFFHEEATGSCLDEITSCLLLMQEKGDTLGSIMKFRLSDSSRLLICQATDFWRSQTAVPPEVERLMPSFQLLLALTDSYHAIVMNPPYMGSSRMNATLSKYVKENYPEGKADLFAVFMEIAADRLMPCGKCGMITMQSWMFLSSFEKLRISLLNDYQIESMLHLGPRTFDELSGEVVQNTAFVISKQKPVNATGTYYRLVEGKDCSDKERMLLSADTGNRIYYPHVPQENFKKIPGCPIGYWLSELAVSMFDLSNLSTIADFRSGMSTTDNNRFLRFWPEVSKNCIGFGFSSIEETNDCAEKWFPHNKGGLFRRWYGNNELVVNWHHNGEEIRKAVIGATGGRLVNLDYSFKPSLTWSRISSGKISVRHSDKGFMFDSASPSAFIKVREDKYLLALLNAKISTLYLELLSPTLTFEAGKLELIPYKAAHEQIEADIDQLVDDNISLSRQDWDAHETSWDFQENELVRLAKEESKQEHSLKDIVENYKTQWEAKFMQLHANEEELNRQFIEIYGLEDELTPNVPLSEVTILQQGEISVEEGKVTWHDDVIVKQLISYAVGCMMGRYSIDRPGLVLANAGDTAETFAGMVPDARFECDDDGIVPLMAGDCGFSDNAALRMADFVRIVFGAESQTANLNFMEQCLGKTIEDYFVKDFWKDHKKTYQNCPIYWLFASRKKSFQVIVYMHRMNPYTVERIRTKYLLPYIERLQSGIEKLEAHRAELSTKEGKRLQALQKQLDECREYHERLQVVAEQAISIDLDDGVAVNYAKFGDVLAKIK